MAFEELDPISYDDMFCMDSYSSYLPLTYDVNYGVDGEINSEPWWLSTPNLCEDLISPDLPSFNSYSTTTTPTSTISNDLTSYDYHSPTSNVSKKRKESPESPQRTSHIPRKVQTRGVNKECDDGDVIVEKRAPAKKPGNRKTPGKSASTTTNNGNSKEGRWAEQLLNPCASAINAGNLNRVQHFLCVLHELASPTGDANRRLADHGLQALKYHLSSANSAPVSPSGSNFASTNPRFFKNSLLNFNDINPWFRIPNSIANSSILQILSEEHSQVSLHILDIGVSHGVQWPTLIEELSSRPGGPPPLVRLTVVNPISDNNQSGGTPFESSPGGYSFSSQLLAFAKTKNINLQINILNNCPLQSLSPEIIKSSKGEALIVCAQFRLHNLKHSVQDDRTEFLKIIRSMEPEGVILSENNLDCSCISCVDFATGFSRRLDYLWRFLDSTSVAYKGRDSDERKMIEGEAAKALTNIGEMNERKENWCERMRRTGFIGAVLGEDAIDGARALLRKYDSNWEMKVDEKDVCAGLSWKGQPVSFCSLWRTDFRTNTP
ncbi:hypothetical protein Leryth_010206 [Lithospermum erythrorhizon]|nr:hypothetical protein Leryth_010206 [Lithospermum erythrorhizon]